jgi:hypothetical protein
LKKTWTKEENLVFGKMLFLDEEKHKGSAKEDIKDEEMVKE